MNIYLALFTTFFKIGLFTFGGGYAMLPMLEREVIANRKWATYDELMDFYAVSQCTPGVIAVNVATLIGYEQKKIPGAITATAGVITPSIIIIVLIAALLTNFADLPLVQHALAGIRIAVCVLILQAVITLMKKGIQDSYGILIFIAAALLIWFKIANTVVIVILAAVAGITVQSLNLPKRKKIRK